MNTGEVLAANFGAPLNFAQAKNFAQEKNFGLTSSFGAGAAEEGGDPDFASVEVLMHFEGADGATTFTDEIGHTVARVGLAAIETTGPLEGSSSLRIPDMASAVVIDHADVNPGSQEFTIEMWFKIDALPNEDPEGFALLFQLCDADDGDTGIIAAILPDGSFDSSTPGNGPRIQTGAGVIAAGVSTHIAITKNASNIYTLWVNGVSIDTAGPNANAFTNTKLRVGCGEEVATSFGSPGLYDEVRLTIGVCRYTEAFTPPTDPFPDN